MKRKSPYRFLLLQGRLLRHARGKLVALPMHWSCAFCFLESSQSCESWQELLGAMHHKLDKGDVRRSECSVAWSRPVAWCDHFQVMASASMCELAV